MIKIKEGFKLIKRENNELLKSVIDSILIGVLISIVFLFNFNGPTLDPKVWLFYILFGSLIGGSNAIGTIVADILLYRRLKEDKLTIRLVISYGIGFAVFYTYSSIFFPLIGVAKSFILYSSLGGGLISVIVNLFFIYADEKEEKLRLAEENKRLAVIEERNRIARELHDSISQNLFGINLNLNTLDYLLAREKEDEKDILAKIKEMVEESQREMRLLIYELSPLELGDKSFLEGVEDLIKRFKSRYNLKISQILKSEYSLLDDKKGLVIYRVLQESLNNIAKYAKNSEVEVYLEMGKQKTKLVIEDNGGGFDLKKVDLENSFGIRGIRERVEGVGGDCDIQSIIGKGTTISIDLPV